MLGCETLREMSKCGGLSQHLLPKQLHHATQLAPSVGYPDHVSQRESQSYGPVLLQTSFKGELIIVRKTCDYVNATTATAVNYTSATVCEIRRC